jgi:hypothetical protein
MGEARAKPHFNPLGLTGVGILEKCSQHKSSSEEPIASKFEYIRAVPIAAQPPGIGALTLSDHGAA